MNRDLAGRLGVCAVVAADKANLARLNGLPKTSLPAVDPSSILYVVFTSGSTGTPKGAIITHANFSSAVLHQQSSLEFSSRSRVFDFVSYAFDVAWSNLLHTLTSGGCLCIPRDDDRRGNITQSMNKLQVNYAHLTPTVARLLDPSAIPTLDILSFIGETVTAADVAQWKTHVRIINTYGPAECTVVSTVERIGNAAVGQPSIGRGIGCNTWVVDSTSHERVLPVGCTGELLIEGPIVGGGYLSDPQKTAVSFVEDPPWLLQGGPGHVGRRGQLYRTGDMVRYNPDGTLVFVGRKDAQVKIRDQRVELGEVEHHVQRNLAEGMDLPVVAEVITPRASSNPVLVAYVAIGEDANASPDTASALLQRSVQGLDDRLAAQLPGYMVPSGYIPVKEIPMTATGKTDRRRLREMGGLLTLEELAALQPARGGQRAPTTEMEQRLQQLWASILGIDRGSIGADDSFLRIGGDSIGAMRLVVAARQQGLSFTVADVFNHPRLCDLAQLVKPATAFHENPAPFSLITSSAPRSLWSCDLLPCLENPDQQILDVYPATYFQTLCVSAALAQPLGRCYHFFIDLPSSDISRIVSSCRSLWYHLDILRTIFIEVDDRVLQIVVKNLDLDIAVQETEGSLAGISEEVYRSDMHNPLTLGRPFTRFFVTHTHDGHARLTIRMCHAQYDGLSLGTIFSTFAAFYCGQKPPAPPSFAGYIKHALQYRDVGLHYWRTLLNGSQVTKLKPCTVVARMCQTDCRLNQSIRFKETVTPPQNYREYTPATIFTALCARMLAGITQSSDVVFGLVVSGRASLPHELQDVIGPCLNAVPIRLHLQEGDQFLSVLSSIHDQRLNGLAYETSQFSDIAEHCTDWPNDTKDFGSVPEH